MTEAEDKEAELELVGDWGRETGETGKIFFSRADVSGRRLESGGRGKERKNKKGGRGTGL